jgi:outer membrane receptor protein involved in Fe transport
MRKTGTDSEGRFVIPFVDPGTYTVTVEAPGFRPAKQDNILVEVASTRPVDFKLDVGTVTQSVEVSATTENLDVDSSSVGQTVQSQTILELPDNGRNPFDFALLVPGVNNVGGASTPHIGGSRNANNEQQIDGMTNIIPENNVGNNLAAYQPVEDSIEEVNVQTSALPAEYGRFSGGTISLITKSGSNEFHGSFFEFIQNGVLDAIPFGAPGAVNTAAKPDMHQYQTGGTVGGPIIHNKAFFFFDFEDSKAVLGETGVFSVPNPAWFNGDFTSLFGTTTPFLFDPNTAQQNSSGVYQRQPFVSSGEYNVIPSSRLSTIAKAALPYFPKPNIPGAGNYNNFLQTGSVPTDYWHFDMRLDGDVTKKWHSSLRYSQLHNTTTVLNSYNNAASPGTYGGPCDNHDYSGTFNNTVTFSPTLLGEFRYGLSKQTSNCLPVGGAFDPSKLGFSSSFSTQAGLEQLEFPNFTFGGNGGFSNLGPWGFEIDQEDPLAQSINGSVVKIAHGHTFKVGGEFRDLRLNFYQWSYPSGIFSSSDAWTRQFPQSADTTGFSIASFLLGLPDSGNITSDPKYITTSQYVAFYGQDDWKVSPKLTLNLGLRYDFEVPREEQNNQMTYWNPNAPSPLQGYQSTLAVSLATAGESCPACTNLLGAMTIVGSNGSQYGRRQAPTQKKDFAPRFGLAYNVTPKVVIRAGASIVFQPSALQASGTTGGTGTAGFFAQTNFIPSYDGGDSAPIATLDNDPFPNGYNLPQGKTSACRASAACVQGISIGNSISDSFFDSYRTPYSIQWNGNVQFAAPGDIKIEVGYLANKGLFLINGDPGKPYDQLSPATLAQYGCTPGAAPASCQLMNYVNNPFYSIIGSPNNPFYVAGTALGSSPTIPMGQLLKRYPQYANIYAFMKPDSASMFNGFTFRADKNMSHGLTFTLSFTDGREYDNSASNVTYLGPTSFTYGDEYNPKAEWGIGAQNVSYDIAASFLYELPFGHGKPFLNSGGKGANMFINGWQISGIENWNTGTPIVLSGFDNGTTAEALWANEAPFSQRLAWSGVTAKLQKPTYQQWFNTNVFTAPVSFAIGNAPRTLSDVNNPSYQDLDAQLAKNTQITERFKVQLRLEMFNAFNHPALAGPNTALTSGQFGVISGYSNNARRIQVAAKVYF